MIIYIIKRYVVPLLLGSVFQSSINFCSRSFARTTPPTILHKSFGNHADYLRVCVCVLLLVLSVECAI